MENSVANYIAAQATIIAFYDMWARAIYLLYNLIAIWFFMSWGDWEFGL